METKLVTKAEPTAAPAGKGRGRVDVITYIGPMCDYMVTQLYDIARQARAAGCTEMHLHLSSEGGSFSAAFAAYNLFQTTGIRLTTHNIGDVKNEAIVPFLAGETRGMSAFAQFLLRGVPKGYDFPRYTGLISFWTNGKININPDQELSLERDDAIKLGIVNDEIVVPNIPLDAVYWYVEP